MWMAFGYICVGYLTICLLMYLFQDRLVFLPSKNMEATPAALGLEYEELYLEVEPGLRIHGWYIPASQARATVLHLHGNGGNISHRLTSIEHWTNMGMNVLMIDYRGYGLSGGSPSEEGLYQDTLAAWNYLLEEKGLAAKDILIFGRSLGGGPASFLAEKVQPGALILESCFTSLIDVARGAYPFLPIAWLSRSRFDVESRLAGIHCPILIAHSPQDDVIPYRFGRKLFESTDQSTSFLEMTGNHNDGFYQMGDQYLSGIDAFLAKHFVVVRD